MGSVRFCKPHMVEISVEHLSKPARAAVTNMDLTPIEGQNVATREDILLAPIARTSQFVAPILAFHRQQSFPLSHEVNVAFLWCRGRSP